MKKFGVIFTIFKCLPESKALPFLAIPAELKCLQLGLRYYDPNSDSTALETCYLYTFFGMRLLYPFFVISVKKIIFSINDDIDVLF